MFPSAMQYTPVAKLSGGEKRRLGLMMVLISNPNFLILDEPTNDLDLITMQKLEEFLLDFPGCLIIVSHDRFFMDKLVQHYFVFEGEGRIRDFNGTYAEWREIQKEEKSEASGRAKNTSMAEKSKEILIQETDQSKKKGLSFKERKEYQKLEKEVADLEFKKSKLESKMSEGNLDFNTIQELSAEHAKLQQDLADKELRWLELAELDN
jgi:ATP-binding cassette subfamily F protein uup